MVALRLDLVVEIGLVLEGVGVDFTAFQRLVGLGVVVEHHGLDGEALFGRLRCDDAPHILVLAADDADLDRLLVLGERRLGRHQAAKGDR